jgi:DNA replication protein DnaC
MLRQPTLDRLRDLKLDGMAEALVTQGGSKEYAALSFEERFALLVEAEWTRREQAKLTRRLHHAHLRYTASLEDVEVKPGRGIERELVLGLGGGTWISEHLNVLITGAAGAGKSYLACALAERACRLGFTALYMRAPRLLQDLHVARADGSYNRLLARLAKLDVLVVDDWLIAPLSDSERRDMLEVIEDRAECRSTVLAGQLPTKAWHAAIGEPMIADAILDRLIHRAHRIELKGSVSEREPRSPLKKPRA